MTDVVEQGRPDRSPRLPPWARRAALAAALVAVAVLAVQTGLIFGEEPTRPDRRGGTPTVTSSAEQENERFVVMRDGAQIVRYDEFGVAPGPLLAPDLPDDAGLYVVDDPGSPARLFTVEDGRLLRVEVGPARVTDLGAATRIVDPSNRAGQLFVQTAPDDGARVVTVDAGSGQVVDPDPFSEDARRMGFVPVGVISQFGVTGLALLKPAGAEATEVAVAWSSAEVEAGRRPAFQLVGRHGRLLGLTDDWLLLLDGSCPGRDCRLTIVSFDRDRFSLREVRPPDGWSFSSGPVGARLPHGALVPVVRLDAAAGPGASGLARLAAGGESALLVTGTTGAVHAAGMVQGEDGDIFFVRLDAGGIRRVARWQPGRPGAVSTLPAMPPLPESGRLVCVCDTTGRSPSDRP